MLAGADEERSDISMLRTSGCSRKIRDRSVDLVKVPGTEHPDDILKQYVAADLLNAMLQKIGMVYMDGRASAAPKLPKEQ